MTLRRILVTSQVLALSIAKTILISLDGLPWYIVQNHPDLMPNLASVALRGGRIRSMRNAFTTLTFPNHYTLATGKWEDEHGIIGNTMYDPVTKAWFTMRDDHDPVWWEMGDPIWNIMERQGVKVACVFWPGCGIPIHGEFPSYHTGDYENMEIERRVDLLAQWLTEDLDIQLALLYFDEPDHTFHQYGVFSDEGRTAIKRVDDAIGYFFDVIPDADNHNVVIVSDHGHHDILGKLLLDPLIGEDYAGRYVVGEAGAVTHVWPLEDSEELKRELVDKIETGLTANSFPAKVYSPQELPPEWHYTNNVRIAPILIVAELGYLVAITRHIPTAPPSQDFGEELVSQHGWDPVPRDSPMRSVFIATGPHVGDFGTLDCSFDSIEVFNIVTMLVGASNGQQCNKWAHSRCDSGVREFIENLCSRETIHDFNSAVACES